MTIARTIKKREKKRKKTPDKPSFFESPLWKRVEEHAKDWDNRETKEFTEKYKHLTKKKVKGVKPATKAKPVDPKKEAEPMKPMKGQPDYEPASRQREEPMEPMEPMEPDEPAMKRARGHKGVEPMEPDKPVEQNPNYQTELKRSDKRNRKIKKARKKKAEKPTSEFMDKYYGKDWA